MYDKELENISGSKKWYIDDARKNIFFLCRVVAKSIVFVRRIRKFKIGVMGLKQKK
jgi:hypothetical protein